MNINTLREAAQRHRTKILRPYDQILDQDGFEAIRAISEHLGGHTVYVPSLRTIFIRCIEAEAKRDIKTGMSLAEAARKYGFSERHIRNLTGRS